jgi:predicted 3-demethylubiquinone-9 3-methyltransferase (glyoxalase superfamily)
MPQITPHLWFDKEAKEAAALYTSIFKDQEHSNRIFTELHKSRAPF